MTHKHIYDEHGLCFECDSKQARNKAKNLSNGLVRVNVWVPSDDRERLLRYAEKLRANV